MRNRFAGASATARRQPDATGGRRSVRAKSDSCAASSCSLERSEGDDAFEHHPAELATVPNIARRVAEVLLAHVLGLRQHVRCHEPARTELPAIGAGVEAESSELAVRAVEAGADEQLFVREEAVDRIDGVLLPH